MYTSEHVLKFLLDMYSQLDSWKTSYGILNRQLEEEKQTVADLSETIDELKHERKRQEQVIHQLNARITMMEKEIREGEYESTSAY